MVEAHSLSFLSVSEDVCQNDCPFFADTLRLCWIQIGWWINWLQEGQGSYCDRNPFDDSLLASGSDDGKVRHATHNCDNDV